MTKHITDKMSYLADSILQYKKRLNNNNLRTILNRGFGIIKDEKGYIVSGLDQISINEKLLIELKM